MVPPFASVVPGAGVFACAAAGDGVVVGYQIVSIFGVAAIRFHDARAALVDQIEVVTPAGFASCDRIYVDDHGVVVAVWRGNEIHGGIVIARRGDAVAHVWRSPVRAELTHVTPAPALGGVFAWGPRDIFLVRADGTSERVPFAPPGDAHIEAVHPWGHDLAVTWKRERSADADHHDDGATATRFACLRGDGAPFLEGSGHTAIPADDDTLLVWRDTDLRALDRDGRERGALASVSDATMSDLLGRRRAPFAVLDDGDLVLASTDGGVVRWSPRTDTTRWRTPGLAGDAATTSRWAPPLRVGGFIALPPLIHAAGGRPICLFDAATGRLLHELRPMRSLYCVCAAGDDVLATACYADESPLWRGLGREEPEALLLPHGRECLTAVSPAPGVVVIGDVSKLDFFRI